MNSDAPFSIRRTVPFGLAASVAGLATACLSMAFHPALAALSSEEVLFQSSDLKIYRTLSRQGTPVLVLTNVDAEGNLLSGGDGASSHPQTLSARTAPESPGAEEARGDLSREESGHAAAAGRASTGGAVRVVVNGEGGTAPVDQRDVEVTTDGTGGTTVIININPPEPGRRETIEVPAPLGYPLVAFGGLPGAFRYPEHLYFLGYGLDTSSPSMFGGLGLNPGNRFGLKPGTPCDRGFDCMFGPVRGRP
ncbi:MAG: hypothetical protein AUH92_06040 [Acidobacteria bacterium 13_1_40CM_4_69_4]|nr:MAG: hypothetical protein AUH92_06040 [Acidobacteria bacterium 13_1_40CM_4_69_4]